MQSSVGRQRCLVFALLVLASCAAKEPERAPQLVARQAVVAATATKDVGEDCSVGGKSECTGNQVCVHHHPLQDRGYTCTVPCAREADCPTGWRCSSVSPSRSDSFFCIPPNGWLPKKAVVPTNSSSGVSFFLDGGAHP